MEKRRIGYLDVARGIAMISIVLGHLEDSGINRVVYTYHLPIFYFISGYFFDRAASLPAFVRKKGRQLLVPFYFSCLLFLLGYMLMNVGMGRSWSYDLKQNLVSVLYASAATLTTPFAVHKLGAIWFLWALFWGEVFLKLLLKCRPALRAVGVLAIFFLSCWSINKIWLPLSIQSGGCALLFIYLGYLLREAMPKLRSLAIPTTAKVAGGLAALAMWLWMVVNFKGFYLVQCQIGNGALDILGSTCGCVLLVLLSKVIDEKLRTLPRVLQFFGRCSLLFLTVHFVELRCLPLWGIYPRLLAAMGWADTRALYLAFHIGVKLIVIPAATLALYRLPFIRRVYGYPDPGTKGA